jgi:8-oxo-dGTP diphosphatase
MLFSNKPKNFKPKFKAVGCFVIFENKILLLQRATHKHQSETWSGPGGKIEKNETPRQAIAREVFEETGILIPKKNFVHFKKYFIKYSDFDFIYDVFSTTLKEKPKVILNKEHKAFTWMSPRNAFSLSLMEDEDVCIKKFFKI